MPSKNEVKEYKENSFYHLYNRGVEKRIIFLDEQDYSVFLSYLKTYILPKDEKNLHNKLADPKVNYKEKDKIIKLLRLNNFHGNLELLAYCLMPNHFHFLVYQKTSDTIDKFMNSLITRYVMYFNKKYKRVGPLFQGLYKAVSVETDEQLIHLSRYIHLQSLASQGPPLRGKQPSSYLNYLKLISQEWVKPEKVLVHFKGGGIKLSSFSPVDSYKSFVESKNIGTEEMIQKLMID